MTLVRIPGEVGFEAAAGATDSIARHTRSHVVDELDRCAADEVVATLDAIRTFLGVDRCVFVIAADQRVLEESLTRAARQETPADDVNPYYSTGSAYLDKVFQYQISLPPLMSQRITRFAADLVQDRGGLWSEINSPYVVSVLVPTHVASPRRVKHLLNTFALTYRLAQDRHRRGLLAEDPRTNAASVAKLACLHVEFPLFARDLEIDARLPEMVLRVEAGQEASPGGSCSAQVLERAKAYGNGGAAPASMIAGAEDATAGESVQPEVQSNRQLLDYLRRTKTVPGPSRDLVFMHSTGTAFGLDGQTALVVEAAAENADIEAVLHRLEEADSRTREGVLRLLNHLMRTGVGVGATNAARTVLGVCGDGALPVESIADSASEMIAVLAETDPKLLDSDTIEAAWRLAGQGTEAGALKLREVVLGKADANGQAFDTSFIIRHPRPALDIGREVFARLIARELVREGGDESVALLYELDDLTATDLMRTASNAVGAALGAALDAHDAITSTQAAAAAPAPAVTGRAVSATPSAPASEEAFDPEPVVSALAHYARNRAAVSPLLAHQVIHTLLRMDRPLGRDAVQTLLAEVDPISDADGVEAVLAAMRVRALGLWPQWLVGIVPRAIAARHAATVGGLATTLWSRSKEEDVSLAAVETAVAGFMGIAEQLPDDKRPHLTDLAIQDVQAPVADDATAAARSLIFPNVQPFTAAGLVDSSQLYQAALGTLSEHSKSVLLRRSRSTAT